MGLLIFDVQRFCVQDGPGIRTTVFLKGCGLQCRWCHNPESLDMKKTLLYYSEKCILCGMCASVCPKIVHQVNEEMHAVQWNKCIRCGRCAEVCPEKSLEIAGEWIENPVLTEKIFRDRLFYMKTGGGVTFSGGEPLLQAKNLLPVIRACKEQQIHVAIETASYVTWENMENLLPYVDLWICDIKAISASLFKEGCGQNIDVICENLKRLSACQGAKMWIRVPLITNFNDTKEELGKIRKFIDSLGNSVERVEILPYHDIGKTKYYAMGKSYELEELPIPTEEMILLAEQCLRAKRRI